MVVLRVVALFLALGLVAAACGGSSISASDCTDITDETLALIQRLVDDVDAEFESMSVEDFVATEGDLPSVERFEQDAATIDDLAAELGCTQQEIGTEVRERLDELTSKSDLGRFIINAIRVGGL
ncbi:MAG: hypothetical protein QGM46_00530 [Actinomycetota bacterium]|nr:hypothetical protein [Actinomycetota bacterium]MDK1016960.1 hypothetical protein [Actinomycetota bacterium]MDK1026620.1 hypothetical protein [Actinomycetota bacterium]MDK1037786.1 hypothetical protein [Actinomycetota bacterium]MDK1096250.1 hypothetical protein [Actinomycetota bacterium]